MEKKSMTNKHIEPAKTVRMLHCPHCGAEYEEGLLRCPYCLSVDDHQDESEFLEDLDEIRDKMEDLPEDAVRQANRIQTKEAVSDFGKILKRIGIVFGVILLIIAAGALSERLLSGGGNSKEKDKEKYLWMQENLPLLDEMYEKGDYEGLLEAYHSDGNGWFYEWEHHDLLQGLSLIEDVRKYDIHFLEDAEEMHGADSKQALDNRAVLLSHELQLLYFDKQASNAKDIETVRGLSAEVLKDLETRFALSEDEQAYFEKLAKENYGYITISECREFLENR